MGSRSDIGSASLLSDRRTTSDDVFEEIHARISKMQLLPGAKLSEVEIARQFDVSRQPVREAFIRLGNMGLLLIRPQRATVVRKISLDTVATARFIRLSIELEVLRKACENFDASYEEVLFKSLAKQEEALTSENYAQFKKLDIKFHKIFCEIARMPHVFGIIEAQKSEVDRLCELSLANKQGCIEVYDDHKKIVDFIIKRDEEKLIQQLRIHLSRLDSTIEIVSQTHSDYFE